MQSSSTSAASYSDTEAKRFDLGSIFSARLPNKDEGCTVCTIIYNHTVLAHKPWLCVHAQSARVNVITHAQ